MSTKRIAICAATLLSLLWSNSALAACTLTLRFTNYDSHRLTVLGSESQVRVNGGTWSKMNFNNVSLAPGETKTASWTSNMSCGGGAKRDFRIRFEDTGDNAMYSNANKTDIDIYDGQTLTWVLQND